MWQVTSGGLVRYCCFLLAFSRGSYKHTIYLFRKDCRLQDQYTVTESKSARWRESCSFAVFSLRLQLFIRQIARVLFNVTSIRGSLFTEVAVVYPSDCESPVQCHRYQRQSFHGGYSCLFVRLRESCSTSQHQRQYFHRRYLLFYPSARDSPVQRHGY